MKRIWVVIVALVHLYAASLAAAQEDTRGTLQAWLEDALSTDDAQVRLSGFSGAWSRRATVDQLTLSDADGPWLVLDDLVLDWDRAALLRGRIDITELSATRLQVRRLPGGTSEPDPFALPRIPSPEAQGLKLPDLPVSVSIASVRLDDMQLASAVLGQPLRAELAGGLSLTEGRGEVGLALRRTDEVPGEIGLRATYDTASRDLDLALDIREAHGGLIASVLALPADPSVALTIRGLGTAERLEIGLSLGTNGTERLSGGVTSTSQQAGTAFAINVTGDLGSLVAAQGQEFLGTRQSLVAQGVQSADGSLSLDALSLQTAQAQITGMAALDPEGWPQVVNVTIDLTGPDGITLPSGLRLDTAQLRAAHDASLGPDWRIDGVLTALETSDMRLRRAALVCQGTLDRGANFRVTGARGDVSFQADGLEFEDPALQAVTGDALTGQLRFDHRPGAPLALQDMAVTLDALSLIGAGSVGPDLTWDLSLDLRDLQRFDVLSGQTLDGKALLASKGRWSPTTGDLEVDATGTTQNVSLGSETLDPLFGGDTTVQMSLARNASGTRVEALSLRSSHLQMDASADLSATTSVADLQVKLAGNTPGPWAPIGELTLMLEAAQSEQNWRLLTQASGPVLGDVTTEALAQVADGQLLSVQATGTVDMPDLSGLTALAERSVSGQLAARFATDLQAVDRVIGLTADWNTTNLALAEPTLDALLQGTGRGTIDTRIDATGDIAVNAFDAHFDRWSASGGGRLGAGEGAVTLSARLVDLGVLAKNLSGPAEMDVRLGLSGGRLQPRSTITGPAGLRVRVGGSAARDLSDLAVAVSGPVPLALANGYTSPNLLDGTAELDVTITGTADAPSVTGRIELANVGVTLPAMPGNMEAGRALITLEGQGAEISGSVGWSEGGRINVSGPVSFAPGGPHRLAIALDGVIAGVPGLISATADGALVLQGNIGAGSALSGDITLQEVEVQLADPPASSAAALIDVTHVGDTAASRDTRRRAGVLQGDTSGGSNVALPLDISVTAPGRVFVRGRGLDAELGGSLRIAGSAAEPAPSGSLSLVRGRMDLLGQRLILSEATANFAGDTIPDLQVMASFTAQDTDITVALSGQATTPDLTLTSVPDYPQDEILARLLFGRPISSISPVQAIQMASAVRTVTGGGGAGFVEQLRQRVGVDDLDVTTRDDGTVDVTVGSYLTENIYSDVEIGSDGTSTINLNLDLGNSVTARGSNSSDGRSGVGLFFERDY